MSDIKPVFVTPDGKQFDNRADATTYLRRPKIQAALKAISGCTDDLVNWLVENQESVEVAFDAGTIRRVTKSDGNKLTKALEALKEIEDNPKISFLQEHADAIKDSFRWPSVKRMTPEEKTLAARNTLLNDTEGNNELVEWILANQEAVVAAYGAGIEKREVSPKATAALEAYRQKRAAEKAAAEAAAAKA